MVDATPRAEENARRARRRRQRAFQGVLLAVGAPVGWLLLRLAGGSSLRHEITTQAGLYLYLLAATGLVLATFGAALGRREDTLEELQGTLAREAITDALTGLYNRRYFFSRLGEDLAAARRRGTAVGLVSLDIDHFKRINDELGHPAGDRALVAFSRALADAAREGETAARLGGEEFAVILPAAGAADARAAAERLRMVTNAALACAVPELSGLTVSAGVASVVPGPMCSADGLVAAADRALYRAKESGRDRVEMAHPRPGEEAAANPAGGAGTRASARLPVTAAIVR
jgi:diguanylate cyclase (GGDEF)-like protein